jgi:hypothetical protein
MIRLPEDNVGTTKHVAVVMIYKIFLIYVCVCVFFCAVFGLYNKLYKMHGIHKNTTL